MPLERHSCLSHSPGLAAALFLLNVPVSLPSLPLALQPQSPCQEIPYQGHEDEASGRAGYCLRQEMRWRQGAEYGVMLGKSGMRATSLLIFLLLPMLLFEPHLSSPSS